MDKPYYLHDCSSCEFLGNETENGVSVDVYYCEKNLGGPTYVVRFSDDPGDYSTWSPKVLSTLQFKDYQMYNRLAVVKFYEYN